MTIIEKKLEQILQDLQLIKKQLKIVADKETEVTNFESSIEEYQKFARNELGIEDLTIRNQKAAITNFLAHSKGVINKQTVKSYLDSQDSPSWKSNQLKALRRYIRDFLHLGRWIEDFDFAKSKAKPKEIPTDEQLLEFVNELPYQIQMVFLVLHNSGLRIGEVMKLKVKDIDFETNMINASDLHTGITKSSWISFITRQTAKNLKQYLDINKIAGKPESHVFPISQRSVQSAFKNTSEYVGYSITPHLLRTIFAEKCTQANIQEKYINAFCGRVSQGILAKHYTDYSPTKLREQYDKVESYLTLG